MKIVLDTNVLASGVFWGGSPFKILERWAANKFQVFVTPEMLKEYQETLEELDPTPNDQTARLWFAFVVKNANLVLPKMAVKICRDPDDDKILDCALSARAKYIVTGDKDLLSLGWFQSIEIVTPAAFLKFF